MNIGVIRSSALRAGLPLVSLACALAASPRAFALPDGAPPPSAQPAPTQPAPTQPASAQPAPAQSTAAPAPTTAPTTPPVDDATRLLARQIAEEGLTLYDAGNYAEALDRFRKAEELVHAPTMGLMVARSLEHLGRLVEASEKYLAVSRVQVAPDASEAFHKAVASSVTEREALLLRIPALVVKLEGAPPGAVVKLDGAVLPSAALGVRRPTDPGAHTLEASSGPTTGTEKVSLKEGETKTVTLRLQPQTVTLPQTSPLRTVGWASVAAGGAGLLLGAVTGGLALSSKGTLDGSGCVEGKCPPAVTGQVDEYNSLRTLSGAGFIAGGVLAAAGLVLVIVAPSSTPAPSPAKTGHKTQASPTAATWSLAVSQTGAVVRGTF